MAEVLTSETLEFVRREACKTADSEVQKVIASLRTQLEDVQCRLAAIEGGQLVVVSRNSSRTLGGRKIVSLDNYERIENVSAKMNEAPEEFATELSRPTSIFGYCAFELSALSEMEGWEADVRRAKLLMLIALLVAVEFLLATALYEASWSGLYKRLWSPPETLGPSSTCFYQKPSEVTPPLFGSKILFGKPRIEWIVAAACYTLVLFSVKSDDRQLLMSACPQGLGVLSRTVFFTSSCLRTLYRSAWIICATVMLIVGSADLTNIIVNSVACTFLLEIDDLAYNTMLSEERQTQYQQSTFPTETLCKPSMVEAFSWCFFAVHAVGGVIMYPWLTLHIEASPHTIRAMPLISIPIFVMVSRAVLLSIASDHSGEWSWRSVFVVMGKSALNFIVAVFVGYFPWAFAGFSVDAPPDFALLSSCLNGGDAAACVC